MNTLAAWPGEHFSTCWRRFARSVMAGQLSLSHLTLRPPRIVLITCVTGFKSDATRSWVGQQGQVGVACSQVCSHSLMQCRHTICPHIISTGRSTTMQHTGQTKSSRQTGGAGGMNRLGSCGLCDFIVDSWGRRELVCLRSSELLMLVGLRGVLDFLGLFFGLLPFALCAYRLHAWQPSSS